MTLEKILLANPRGFCSGVRSALNAVESSIEKFGSENIYILKEIVHNKTIVNSLSQRGVRSVTRIEDVPEGQVLIFSAHGVPPSFYELATNRKLTIIDATCPLVKKVHKEAKELAREGYLIFYIGHEGHDEAIGVIAECPKSIILIRDMNDAENLKNLKTENTQKLACLTQTTLSVYETEEIIKILKSRFPSLYLPEKSDICYATTDRQEAVKNLSFLSELVLIIGSQNSSNSKRLKETSESLGTETYLIDSPEEIRLEWLERKKIIGISAGASAPEPLVKETVNYLLSSFPSAQVEVEEFR